MTDSDPNACDIREVATILAAGLLRVLDRKSSRNLAGDSNSLLDCAGPSEGDVAHKAKEATP